MRNTRKLGQVSWLLGLAAAIWAGSSMATSYTTAGSGTWDSASTWSPAGVPGSGDTISWSGDHDVQIDSVAVFSGGTFNVVNTLNALQFNSGSLTLDSGTFTVSAGTVLNNIGSNNLFTIASGATFAQTAGAFENRSRVTFVNHGQMALSGGSYSFFFGHASGNVLQNNSSFTVSGSGYRVSSATADATHSFDNTASGTILADGATLRVSTHFNDTGGSIAATNGGIVRFDGGTTRTYSLAGTALSTDTGNGSAIELGGLFSSWTGTIAAGSEVLLAEPFMPATALATIDFGSAEIGWDANADPTINTSDGRFIVLQSPVRLDTTVGGNGNTTITVQNNTTAESGLRISAGNTLTMAAGLFLLNASGTELGVIDNLGTFAMQSGEVRLQQNSVRFRNGGLVNISGGYFNLNNANAVFENDANLTASGGGGRVSGIGTLMNPASGTITADGALFRASANFSDTGGALSAINGGTIRFDSITSTYALAGTVLSTDSGNGSQIQLGGLFSSWTGTVAANSDVQLAQPFRPNAAIATIDFGSTEIGWNSNADPTIDSTDGRFIVLASPVRVDATGNIFISLQNNTTAESGLRIAAGSSLTMTAGLLLLDGSGAQSGVLDNLGTLAIEAGELRCRFGSSLLRNTGQLNFTGGFIDLNNVAALLQNSGTITAAGSGGRVADVGLFTNSASGVILASGALFRIDSEFDDMGGTISAVAGGTVRLGSISRTYNLNGTDLSTDTGNGSRIELRGGVGTWSGTIAAGSEVAIASEFGAAQTAATINFGSTEIVWEGGNNLQNNSTDGSFVVFESPVRLTAGTTFIHSNNNTTGLGGLRIAAGSTLTLAEGGGSLLVFPRKQGSSIGSRLENQGTLIFEGGEELRIETGSGVTNSGVIVFQGSGGKIGNNGGTGVVDTTGTVRVDATAGTANGRIDAGNSVSQFSGNALTGGTWEVLAGATSATLNVDPANAGITTIGAGATVVLGSTGAGVAVFAELPALDTVAGEFRVNGTMNYDSAAAGGIQVSSTGTIGGTGTITDDVAVDGTLAAGASVGTLTINGNLALTATALTEIEVDGPAADQTIVNGTVTVAGTLTVIELGPPTAASYVIIANDGVDPVAGTFAGLPEGTTFTAGSADYQISYSGGDGNDVELTLITCDCTTVTGTVLDAICTATSLGAVADVIALIDAQLAAAGCPLDGPCRDSILTSLGL